MKVLKKQKVAVCIWIGMVSVSLLAARLVWGQAAPVLGISQTRSNAVLLTVTNGVSTGRYQIYWTELLAADAEWLLLTNGSIGQTQFMVPMEDWNLTFFRAVANTNFVPPSLNVIILSPTNGMLLQ